jgi:two-component system, chemotaxis family, chemotaxis protein CheY
VIKLSIRILIVDDSAFMRNIIKNALTGMDVLETYEASNADESIIKYKEKKPDLVFMDIVMPGRTGLEALKEIKSIDSNAKIVMCTSVGQDKIIEEAVNSGAYDFITKPFKPEEIKSVVTKVMG